RDQAKNPCPKKIPATIAIGAGDISKTENGDSGVASNTPHLVRLFAPKLMRNAAPAAKTAPVQSIATLDCPPTGLNLLLSQKITRASKPRNPKVKRQPIQVENAPAIKNASTMPMACAPPSHPRAFSC